MENGSTGKMATKKDLRSYFNTAEKKASGKNNKTGLKQIIVAETNEATKADVDMAREEVKKQVSKRKKYQTVPER